MNGQKRPTTAIQPPPRGVGGTMAVRRDDEAQQRPPLKPSSTAHTNSRRSAGYACGNGGRSLRRRITAGARLCVHDQYARGRKRGTAIHRTGKYGSRQQRWIPLTTDGAERWINGFLSSRFWPIDSHRRPN